MRNPGRSPSIRHGAATRASSPVYGWLDAIQPEQSANISAASVSSNSSRSTAWPSSAAQRAMMSARPAPAKSWRRAASSTKAVFGTLTAMKAPSLAASTAFNVVRVGVGVPAKVAAASIWERSIDLPLPSSSAAKTPARTAMAPKAAALGSERENVGEPRNSPFSRTSSSAPPKALKTRP